MLFINLARFVVAFGIHPSFFFSHGVFSAGSKRLKVTDPTRRTWRLSFDVSTVAFVLVVVFLCCNDSSLLRKKRLISIFERPVYKQKKTMRHILSLKTCLKAGLKAAKKSMEIYPRRSGQQLLSKSYQIPLNRVHPHLESVHFLSLQLL